VSKPFSLENRLAEHEPANGCDRVEIGELLEAFGYVRIDDASGWRCVYEKGGWRSYGFHLESMYVSASYQARIVLYLRDQAILTGMSLT
jgi:hypothetical protein